jgi:hypothetical protein
MRTLMVVIRHAVNYKVALIIDTMRTQSQLATHLKSAHDEKCYNNLCSNAERVFVDQIIGNELMADKTIAQNEDQH